MDEHEQHGPWLAVIDKSWTGPITNWSKLAEPIFGRMAQRQQLANYAALKAVLESPGETG